MGYSSCIYGSQVLYIYIYPYMGHRYCIYIPVYVSQVLYIYVGYNYCIYIIWVTALVYMDHRYCIYIYIYIPVYGSQVLYIYIWSQLLQTHASSTCILRKFAASKEVHLLLLQKRCTYFCFKRGALTSASKEVHLLLPCQLPLAYILLLLAKPGQVFHQQSLKGETVRAPHHVEAFSSLLVESTGYVVSTSSL